MKREFAYASWAAMVLLAMPTPEAMAACYPVAQRAPSVLQAALRLAELPAGAVQLTYLGHSSFLIRSAEGATALTDFNGYIGGLITPDIVTMNNAHSSHYTDYVDPRVNHVLRGWASEGGLYRHDVIERDMRVRNIPTNLRGVGGTRWNGNSIFVFEVADICIAHLGHLHHTLSDHDLGELGIIDVLLVPVDGAYTMAQGLMVDVIKQINPAVVIPMHYFTAQTLRGFLARIGDSYEIDIRDAPTVVLSRSTLPYHQVIVLPGG